MKISTLLTLGATGMAGTAAAVWLAVDAPHPRTASAATGTAAADPAHPGPTDPPAKPAQPVVDKSHFQAGKTLMVEGRLGHQVLPADVDSETFLFADITSDAVGHAAKPVPLNLSIAIDRSGSMRGKRLANALAGTRTAINRLRDGDVVSVIEFDSSADVVVSPTTVDAVSRPKILAALSRVHVGGDTCISCGVDASMHLLGERTGMVSRVLLLSDGFATAGIRDLPGFRQLADQCRRMGASVTTIGVDVGFDEKIMAALAQDSNGSHYFAEDAGTLPGIFDREMASLEKTVANHAELIVDLSPGVFVDHVYDRINSGGGSQVVIPLGAFSAGDHKTALLRLRVPRGPAGERPIAAVRLRYDDLIADKAGSCEGELAARASADPADVTPLDSIVSARVSASETAEALEQANDLFREGNTRQATQVIQQQTMHMEHMRTMAKKGLMDPMRGGDLDAAFDKQAAALGRGSGGFQPPTPTAAPPTTGDRPAESQVRSNQADALKLEE